jgi:hypothetical protein
LRTPFPVLLDEAGEVDTRWSSTKDSSSKARIGSSRDKKLAPRNFKLFKTQMRRQGKRARLNTSPALLSNPRRKETRIILFCITKVTPLRSSV